MAITVQELESKVFGVVDNGYDCDEVEDFLEEIIKAMEDRDQEIVRLQERVASMTKELDQAHADLAVAAAAPAVPTAVADTRHAAESFELVLTKAKGAYEEIVAAADARAEEIVDKANEDAANARAKAELQIADLNKKLSELRGQASEYCTTLKKAMDTHAATMEQIKRLL